MYQLCPQRTYTCWKWKILFAPKLSNEIHLYCTPNTTHPLLGLYTTMILSVLLLSLLHITLLLCYGMIFGQELHSIEKNDVKDFWLCRALLGIYLFLKVNKKLTCTLHITLYVLQYTSLYITCKIVKFQTNTF